MKKMCKMNSAAFGRYKIKTLISSFAPLNLGSGKNIQGFCNLSEFVQKLTTIRSSATTTEVAIKLV